MGSHLEVKNAKLMAAVLMIGSFIGLFGETALNMALTNIMEDFSIGPGTAQWLTNEACDNGRISVNGRVVKASYDVKVGDKIENSHSSW